MVMLWHLAIVAVMASVLSIGCTNAIEEPQFRTTTMRDNHIVEVKAEKETTVFSVHSQSRISETEIKQTGRTWSDIVILRLHPKVLEHFKLTNGKVTLEAAASTKVVLLTKDAAVISHATVVPIAKKSRDRIG